MNKNLVRNLNMAKLISDEEKIGKVTILYFGAEIMNDVIHKC